jgi:hypothetical protein
MVRLKSIINRSKLKGKKRRRALVTEGDSESSESELIE